MTIKCRLSFSNEAARHGPAAGVTPVLTPLNPFPKSLLVFVHKYSLGSSYMSLPLHSYWLLLTISLTIGSYIAMHANLPISAAVDLLFLCDNPWGLAKFVLSRPRARAYLFIS